MGLAIELSFEVQIYKKVEKRAGSVVRTGYSAVAFLASSCSKLEMLQYDRVDICISVASI